MADKKPNPRIFTIKDLWGAYEVGLKDGRAEAFEESLRILASVVTVRKSAGRGE